MHIFYAFNRCSDGFNAIAIFCVRPVQFAFCNPLFDTHRTPFDFVPPGLSHFVHRVREHGRINVAIRALAPVLWSPGGPWAPASRRAFSYTPLLWIIKQGVARPRRDITASALPRLNVCILFHAIRTEHSFTGKMLRTPSYLRQALRKVLWFCSGWTFHLWELSPRKPRRFHVQGRNCSCSLCNSWGSTASCLEWHLFLLSNLFDNRGCFAGRLGTARCVLSIYPFG